MAKVDVTDARILGNTIINRVSTIIQNEQFQVRIILPKEAANRPMHEVTPIIRRHDTADVRIEWQGESHCRPGVQYLRAWSLMESFWRRRRQCNRRNLGKRLINFDEFSWGEVAASVA